MKKVIWVFGESATGKSTLINAILNNENDIKTSLELDSERIDVIKNTISLNLNAYDDENHESYRKKIIEEKIKEFLQSDNTVLLIKGQTNDMDDRYGNTLKQFALDYPNLDKEIYLLEVSDLDFHYQRFINKDWFKKDKTRYEKIFPKEWLPSAILNHREIVYSFKKYGFSILNIDSTNGFVVKKENDLYERKNY